MRRTFDAGLRQHYEMLAERGDCYASLGDYAKARASYERAALLAPDEPDPYVSLGVLAVQVGRSSDAVEAFEAARRIDPTSAEAYGGLAMVHQQAGRYDAAFGHYLKCLELNADNLFALLGLFQTSCQMGTFAKIIHYLTLYLDRHPDDAAVLFCLATLQAREGRLDEAREMLLQVLAAEPDRQEAAELLREVEASLARRHPQGALRP